MNAPSRAADLIHKVWFITGASSGLGLELAHAALKRGDFVVATSRAVTSVLGDHDNLLSVRLDVTDEAQAFAAAKSAVERFGRIDVLVNNACYGRLGWAEEASGKEVEQQFATNVFGLLNVARAVLPQMRRAGRGHVVNISAISGPSAWLGRCVYTETQVASSA